MLCIVSLLGLWCIHANVRVVAEFWKNCVCLQRVLLLELVVCPVVRVSQQGT